MPEEGPAAVRAPKSRDQPLIANCYSPWRRDDSKQIERRRRMTGLVFEPGSGGFRPRYADLSVNARVGDDEQLLAALREEGRRTASRHTAEAFEADALEEIRRADARTAATLAGAAAEPAARSPRILDEHA